MEILLNRFKDHHPDPTDLLALLVAELRPENPDQLEDAERRLRALCHLLETRSDLRRAVREAILGLSTETRHADLYASTGILPNTGFFTELFRRIGHKLLPEALDDERLRTRLRRIFPHASDARWVTGLGETAWLELIAAIHFEETPANAALPHAAAEVLRALRIISFWIAAGGMDPELLRLDPALEQYESPFATQNAELIAYIDTYPLAWRQPAALISDDKHLRVLLDQCRQSSERIRKRAARDGTSIRLTFHLQRLQQLIDRCEALLDVLDALLHHPDGEQARPPIVRLFTHLVAAECRRDDLRAHWRQNTELIALRVTENAGQHGEHYISETRAEYFAIARSAAVGGFIVAFMACLKLLLAKTEMAPLTGALAFCLNYGLGFCLIHFLHGTIATKQPAMTANAIAATICQSGGKLCDAETLAALVARTVRTQIVAILGNVGVAVPVAALIAFAVYFFSGTHFVPPAKAEHLLTEQSLIHSGVVVYAAIAGICLFVAGLISGYFDNYAAYNRIPQRIRQLAWARRLLGEYRLQRVANYVGDNLGALAGNFLFGFMLGGTTLLGFLFGLPLDIRHVAFSSAFVGLGFVGLDGHPNAWLLLWSVLGVAAIGTINLVVSFSLALNVALRSRQVSGTPWKTIIGAVWRHLRQRPRDFFMPPKNNIAEIR